LFGDVTGCNRRYLMQKKWDSYVYIVTVLIFCMYRRKLHAAFVVWFIICLGRVIYTS